MNPDDPNPQAEEPSNVTIKEPACPDSRGRRLSFYGVNISLLICGPPPGPPFQQRPPGPCVIFLVHWIPREGAPVLTALKCALRLWLEATSNRRPAGQARQEYAKLACFKEDLINKQSSLQPFLKRQGILKCSLVFDAPLVIPAD